MGPGYFLVIFVFFSQFCIFWPGFVFFLYFFCNFVFFGQDLAHGPGPMGPGPWAKSKPKNTKLQTKIQQNTNPVQKIQNCGKNTTIA